MRQFVIKLVGMFGLPALGEALHRYFELRNIRELYNFSRTQVIVRLSANDWHAYKAYQVNMAVHRVKPEGGPQND